MAESFKGARAPRVDTVPILLSTLARQVHVTQLVSPDLEELTPPRVSQLIISHVPSKVTQPAGPTPAQVPGLPACHPGSFSQFARPVLLLVRPLC